MNSEGFRKLHNCRNTDISGQIPVRERKEDKVRSSQGYPGNAQGAVGTVKYRKLHLNTREKLLYAEEGLKKKNKWSLTPQMEDPC